MEFQLSAKPAHLWPEAALVVSAQTGGAMSDDTMKSDKMAMDHMKMMGDNVKMMSDHGDEWYVGI